MLAPGRPLPHPRRRGPDHAARRAARVASSGDAERRRCRRPGRRARPPGDADDSPSGPLTTYGVGGPAALFVEVEGPDDLSVVRAARAHGRARATLVPVFVLGRGSNLLVADAGFDGLVLHLGPGFAGSSCRHRRRRRAARAQRRGEPRSRAGAALALPVLARRVADAGWAGLSWAVGVPGLGRRCGAHERRGARSDMAACLLRYTWVDLFERRGRHRRRRPSRPRLPLVVGRGDRRSWWRRSSRSRRDRPTAEQAAVAAIVRWRREHQPGGSNAGSVFTNPPDDSAGRLIEAAGLKGFRLGTAHVSEKHANFIQADKAGRADDVRALMEHVRARGGRATAASRSHRGPPPGLRRREDWSDVPRRRAAHGERPPDRGSTAGGADDAPRPRSSAGRRRRRRTGVRSGRRRADDGRGRAGTDGRAGTGGPHRGGGGARPHRPRISARRTAVMRQQGRRRLRLVVIGLAAAACLVGAWFLLHSPLFSARAITVVGRRARDGGAGRGRGGSGRPPAPARRERRRSGARHRAAAVGAHGLGARAVARRGAASRSPRRCRGSSSARRAAGGPS